MRDLIKKLIVIAVIVGFGALIWFALKSFNNTASDQPESGQKQYEQRVDDAAE
ncbi:MAG: hypothetical protein IJM44_05535 [Ruminococcus sp.]|jgi:hypothetical protein|nr:hypothetical protein [Ruminococcus sp.]